LIALHDCLRFLSKVEAQASPEALTHDALLLDFFKSANVELIIDDGRRDCEESKAALHALAPTDPLSLWEERIGEAFDRVGRCRERLRLMPRPQYLQSGGDKTHEPPAPQEQSKPCGETSAPQAPVAKPDLGPPPRAQVHFKHDAPSPGELGEGSIVQRGNLRQVLAYVAQAPSAPVKLVGHASVEASAQHNRSLAERRSRLVEGLVRSAGAQHVQVEAVGEELAQGAQGSEYTHEAWRRVDVELSAF
jgi:outer membrane protein OmpA-like peptidoglycan-associated protein